MYMLVHIHICVYLRGYQKSATASLLFISIFILRWFSPEQREHYIRLIDNEVLEFFCAFHRSRFEIHASALGFLQDAGNLNSYPYGCVEGIWTTSTSSSYCHAYSAYSIWLYFSFNCVPLDANLKWMFFYLITAFWKC